MRRFRTRFVQSVGAVLGEVVASKELMQWVTEEAGEFRERVYSPLRTLQLFIEQVLSADQSCQDAVARGLSERVGLGESASTLNTGPYCKARARLPVGLVKRLVREVGQRLCAEQPGAWRWRGREVKLVDGMVVSMPDTASNQSSFPQNAQQGEGLGFPLARIVAIVSLSCGALLEWAMSACEGKETGETALLWGLVQWLNPGNVLIADRCYAGYFMIAWMIQHGVDVVIRQHPRRRTDFGLGRRLGARDHVATWRRPMRPAWMDPATYASMPETLELREARVGGWTLVSTLTDAREVSKADLLALYRSRWQVELDVRSIKSVMQMDMLRCKTPEMVDKEVAVHFAGYNLVRAVMTRAAYLGALLPRQLSFKGALQLLRAWEENLRHSPRCRIGVCQAHLLAGISTMKLLIRPWRVEPRAVKRRPKTHALLTEPRAIVRARFQEKQNRYINAYLR